MAEFTVTRLDLQDRLDVRVALSGIENLSDQHGSFIPNIMALRYERGVLLSVFVSGPYLVPVPDPWGEGSLDYVRGQIFFRKDRDEPVPEVLRQGISKVQMEDPDLFAYLKRWGT